jgi:hypothetical protein
MNVVSIPGIPRPRMEQPRVAGMPTSAIAPTTRPAIIIRGSELVPPFALIRAWLTAGAVSPNQRRRDVVGDGEPGVADVGGKRR